MGIPPSRPVDSIFNMFLGDRVAPDKAILARLPREFSNRDQPAPKGDAPMFDNTSSNQLLTIQYQLHTIIKGTPPDQNEERVSHFKHGVLDTYEREELERSVDELVCEWMGKGFNPQEITKHFGSKAEITLKWLRENILAWSDYERAYELHQFADKVAEKIAEYNIEDYTSSSLLVVEAALRDESLRFEAEKKVKQYIKLLRQELAEQERIAKSLFPEAFSQFPKKWMYKTESLRKGLESKKGQRFITILNLIWERKLSYPESQKLLPSLKKSKLSELGRIKQNKPVNNKDIARVAAILNLWEGNSGKWILVHPKPEDLAKELGVTTETIRSDIQRMVRAGALIQLPKPGPNSPFIYVIAQTGGSYTDKDGEIKKRKTMPLLREQRSRWLQRALEE